jgi:hypothetical protein
MILIALLAMGLGWAVESAHRRERFQELTLDYTLDALDYSLEAIRPGQTALPVCIGIVGSIPPESVHWSELDEAKVRGSVVKSAYYSKLSDKYRFASTYPWLPVLPDQFDFYLSKWSGSSGVSK